MTTNLNMTIFDMIVFGFGLYMIFSAIRMSKTGMPAQIFVSKSELGKMKNAKKFCEEMYKPTLIFGGMACVYGVFELFNRYVIKVRPVQFLCVICFVIVCVWYVKEYRRTREAYI